MCLGGGGGGGRGASKAKPSSEHVKRSRSCVKELHSKRSGVTLRCMYRDQNRPFLSDILTLISYLIPSSEIILRRGAG